MKARQLVARSEEGVASLGRDERVEPMVARFGTEQQNVSPDSRGPAPRPDSSAAG